MPEDNHLNMVTRKFLLCKSIGLQPSEYDNMFADEADVFWLLDQSYHEKDQLDIKVKEQQMKAKQNR